jgi:hypothetical protein
MISLGVEQGFILRNAVDRAKSETKKGQFSKASLILCNLNATVSIPVAIRTK